MIFLFFKQEVYWGVRACVLAIRCHHNFSYAQLIMMALLLMQLQKNTNKHNTLLKYLSAFKMTPTDVC